jgi:hypothetical protein
MFTARYFRPGARDALVVRRRVAPAVGGRETPHSLVVSGRVHDPPPVTTPALILVGGISVLYTDERAGAQVTFGVPANGVRRRSCDAMAASTFRG